MTEPVSKTNTIRIELLQTLAAFERCVELQLDIWGYGTADVIPRKMFLVAHRIGGIVLGAFDGATMIGFAMGLPGYRNRTPYLHSHMLAVLPAYRDSGVGRRLKLAQREVAIDRGFDRMEWTFDPLEIKNAYLNIAKLGAIARRYEPDFYGPSTSPLQGGLPTDRLYAEWWLNSPRVHRALAGSPEPMLDEQAVEVPAAIYQWKQSEATRPQALTLQSKNRAALQQAFEHGLAVVGYALDGERNGRFLLGRFTE